MADLPVPISDIADPDQIRVKLLASGRDVHAPMTAVVAASIHGAPTKATPVNADEFGYWDSVGLRAVKTTWSNIKATLKTYFDTLYQPLAAALTSWAAVTRAAGFDTFVATPNSANLRALLTDETGTGAAYFAGGALGTPSSGTATNLTGLPVSSGISGLAAGVATFLATPSSANLRTALTDETGGGAAVFADAPTITGIPVFSGVPSLTGGALTFPATQVPSAGVNDLDDYEEGTWTPRIDGTTVAGAGTYTTQAGVYTKVGNLVDISMDLSWSAHTGTGNMVVAGLPFTCGATTAFAIYWESLTYAATPTAVIGTGGTTIILRASASGGGVTPLPIDTAARLIIGGTYRV